jgi:hypothetical protein
MAKKRFHLTARVSTDSPSRIRSALEGLVTRGKVNRGGSPDEFLVDAEFDGVSAKELNRALLSALRRVEKRTRLRAEWTSSAGTERFFDYVSKGIRKEST